MIETLIERIRTNNRRGEPGYDQGNLDGRIEAYEDVLRLLGFYDDEGQPRYRQV